MEEEIVAKEAWIILESLAETVLGLIKIATMAEVAWIILASLAVTGTVLVLIIITIKVEKD